VSRVDRITTAERDALRRRNSIAGVKRALDTAERREAAGALPEHSFLRPASYWRERLKQLEEA
jgi:hypothetical protein